MSIAAKVGLFLLLVVAVAVLCNRLFRFTDHDDHMDDEGGWK